jgi:hypothetical protein
MGTGDIHRRLVRFDGNQCGVLGQRVANVDQDFDDSDVFETADVGDFDFNTLAHGSISNGDGLMRFAGSPHPTQPGQFFVGCAEA